MEWFDKYYWRKTLVATVICLLGCSIGSMGISALIINYSFPAVLALSFAAGLISCFLFVLLWHILIQHKNLRDSFNESFKMSFISMLIMIATEDLAFLFFAKSLQHPGHFPNHIYVMSLGMTAGFVLALPYNYYQLYKNGNICH